MKKFYVSLFSLACFFVSCTETRQETKSESEEDKKEITINSVSLRDLQGNPLSADDLKGKRVFLNFWATWCKPCLAEMPSIDRASLELADESVIFIAASDEKPDRVKSFAEKNDYRFQIVTTDTDLSKLGVFALPTTFIFDEKGRLVYQETGARDWDSSESLKIITEANRK